MRRAWPLLRLSGGAAVLAALLWRFGTGPVAEAWRVTSLGALLAALGLTAVATFANAWRWRAVSAALGAPISTRESLTSYYRSQVLNSCLPGGVLGDAHRGYRHGRTHGSVATGLRATAWDRATGQLVQVAALLVVLTVAGTPLQDFAPVPLGALLVLGAVAWLLARRGGARGVLIRDGRALLAVPCTWRVVAGSCISSAAHVALFAVAASAAGVHLTPATVCAVALVVLVGSSVPVNVAGWGPREGVTVWVFGAVGLGAATGLTVSIVFGVLSLVGTLPGVLVLVGDAVALRRTRTATEVSPRAVEEARHG